MRICRAKHKNEVFYGVIEGDSVLRIAGGPFDKPEYEGSIYSLSDVRLLAPCEPSKIVAVGKNYSAHAAEMNEGQPEEPLLFIKPGTSVIGSGDTVIYPAISKRVDYEGELGIVIGKKCRYVKEKEFASVVLGYTCLNDVTARDIQKSVSQWTRGKGFDTFCPLGPWIETDIEPGRLNIETRLNKETRQSSNTSYMTHSPGKLIAYISRTMTLLPGDVIATGTPEGIGPMQIGDIVEVEIEGIGTLVNKITSEIMPG
ncbi:MAG: Ureidoglycolate lyase [Firmicutes bacterium ADurb.Bin182]|nr:MAG: Ureidoglycolate lyase [Firmicutes bacterium ADurb.Bin182]